jgi:hypothetical protein
MSFDDQNWSSFPDVIASVSQRSNLPMLEGLLRRFAPRNDHITELECQSSLGVRIPPKIKRLSFRNLAFRRLIFYSRLIGVNSRLTN